MMKRPLRPPTQPSQQAGFTIVELMIATLVFSTILVVITFGVINFSSAYYKGINSSTTQDTARSVIDTVAQAIQFSGSVPQIPAPGANSICIGNQQFVFNLGKELLLSTDHGLAQITGGSCSATPTGGTELLDSRMRLIRFAVDQPKNPDGSAVFTDQSIWNVTIAIAYGDNDLLCDSSVGVSAAGGCAGTAATIADPDIVTAAAAGDLHCKSVTGSQFCDIVALSTTVNRRIGLSH